MTDFITMTPAAKLASGQDFAPTLTIDYPDGQGMSVYALFLDSIEPIFDTMLQLARAQGDQSLAEFETSGVLPAQPGRLDNDATTVIEFGADVTTVNGLTAALNLVFEFPKDHVTFAYQCYAAITPEQVANMFIQRMDASTVAALMR
ncbi:hypothetical protein [Aeromicrobium sp. 179-A 4D2 NHS]|uniref:hypothetical protein n=1 Tax=Aeromicrobium sp. 179-A 4D2 NHS TaxID=3142375 RepID=UPI0039A043DA